MKRQTCKQCERKYWAKTTPAKRSGDVIIEPSEPKTQVCKPCRE